MEIYACSRGVLPMSGGCGCCPSIYLEIAVDSLITTPSSSSQPTLSNGIALLEEEFGGQLFARTTRRVDLTPFGTQLLPLIEAVLQAQAELEAGVSTFHNPAHKIVRIKLSPLTAALPSTQVLEAELAAHSGLKTSHQ